ncbi:MAG TPA: hypothetical protein DCY07_07280 [Rhodospirillaceae bacterium]|nr:hypothetical protein [Rhodospirillaceae bacterium]
MWKRCGAIPPFDEGTVAGWGRSCIALIPHNHPNVIVKFVEGTRPRGVMSVGHEFDLMEKLLCLKGDRFVTPIPLSWGKKPNYLAMEYVGKPFLVGQSCEDEIETIGRAVGEFSALTFLNLGRLHADICHPNLTRAPCKRIGIIDIASVCRLPALENMFLTPLLAPGFNISPYIADEFTRQTGIALNFDHIVKINEERLLTHFSNFPDPKKAEIFRDSRNNIEEWRRFLASQKRAGDQPKAKPV